MASDYATIPKLWVTFVIMALFSGMSEATPPAVDFTRDVRPILSENCFHCHGPDAAERQADLRLDVWKTEGDILGAEHVISPGKLDASEFVARITSDEPDMRMPPADSGKSLSPEQIEILGKWIAGGAEYKQHWAFVAPRRPNIPSVRDSSWIRNPIDTFILARLERDGLKPSVTASPNTLLRRLSLDLVGLPPTLEELAEFENAGGEKAYAQQVRRLLNSPHFGERWGRLWLDAARYSDSDGFEKDKPRFVWMYRDWVIDAINEDMPYDEFLVEQVAGDLLSERTQDTLVATGFLRNSMINEEGGIDPEQFRMEAMFDRMDAIGKAMLGVTVQCAQCHSHKYDPLTHTDYYRMFAFLNNCHEGQISVYTPDEQEQWKTTYGLIRELENRLREDNPDWPERMGAWEESVRGQQTEWTVIRPKPLDESGQKYYSQEDGSLLAAGYAPTMPVAEFGVEVAAEKIAAIRLELFNDPNLPHGGPGRSIYGTCALTEFRVDAAPVGKPAEKTSLKFAKATADVNPPERELEKIFDDRSQRRRVTGPIDYANDGDALTAWSVDIGPRRSNVPRKAVFVLDKPLEMKQGARLTLKLAQQHGGWNSDENQNNNLGRFRFSITADEKAVADPVPAEVRAILAVPAAERTPEQIKQVFSYWRTTVSEWQEENRQIDALWHSHPRGTTQLVLLEREKPRVTHRLERGNFLAPAEEVSPGVPTFLHPLSQRGPANAPPTRLDFARWLADRRSPTTARAIVNRIWQAYFGTGLVATSEDLGTQGETPSHPELLDWLAVELMDHNWSLKHIHRLIVNSATYRQSSKVTPELLARDPANRLLARGARFRVDAEGVRDIALAASGLLYDKIGGPSVHPPAPEFLFQPPISYGPKTWIVETGPNRYRRALYTFRYRALPYPMLQTFDAPNGEVACARRVRSNTPLQALTTLNEPLFVECARALALKIVAEGGSSEVERLSYAVRRCLSREPQQAEIEVLQEYLKKQTDRFAEPSADPWLLLVDNDKQKDQIKDQIPTNTDPATLAAWTALARVVLNLDETITKE
jgi:mono/diheme cytochrome c family protein